MVHTDYKEMIPIHALAALDAQDERALKDHLASCVECREELDEWTRVCESMSLSSDPQEPSPQLRARILAVVAQKNSSNVVSLASRRSIWNSLGSVGVVAASIVFVGLLIAVLALWNQNRLARQRLNTLSAQVEASEQQLAQQQKLIQQLTGPDSHMSELTATNSAPGAKAMITYDKTGHAMLIARGLPTPPAGKMYQLWYIVGNTPMPGKVFTINQAGTGMLEDQMPAEAMKSATFAITMEDAEGASKPTGGMLLHSAL